MNADSEVKSKSGNIVLSASETSSILSTAWAASLAASIGGTAGISVSGAGASANNSVSGNTQAYLSVSKVTSAGALTLAATNSATITATVEAASVAAAGGGAAGVGAALGASLATNTVSGTTQAYLGNSTVTAGGALTATATATQAISASVIAGSAAVTGGGAAGVGLAGAGASSINTVGMNVKAFIDGDGSGMSAASIGLTATDNSSIVVQTGAASIAASFGGAAGVSIAVGVGLAQNTITNSVAASITNADSGITTRGAIALSASETSSIRSTAWAASLAASVGGAAGVSVSGAGASANNTVAGTTEAFIAASIVNSAGSVSLSAVNTSGINATVAAASAAAASGGAAGVGAALGSSLATNTVAGTTQAYLSNSTLVSGGALSATATATQTISASVIAGSAAVTGGGAAGVGLAGAGASSINTVGMNVKAYIDGDGTGGVRAAAISLVALDSSSIDVFTGASSLAASFGGAAGISVAIGVGLAKNTISNDVQAFITNADTGITTTSASAGDIVISATERASIHSLAMAASVAAGFGGAAGIGVAGAGADATNVVLTKANSYVNVSKLASARNVSISSLSTGATLFTLPTALTAADLTSHARMDKKQALAASSDLPGVTAERAGTIAPIDIKLRAAFTAGGNPLAAGDIQMMALDGTSAAEQAWNITSASAWQVVDADHNVFNLSLNAATGAIDVSKPVISAQVISAAMGVGSGGAAGVGAAIGASLARNLIGLGLDQAATISTVSSNQLTFALPHGRLTGDPVLYQNGTGTQIDGLVPGTTYYCIRVNNTTMKLARTATEARAGSAISLSLPAAAAVVAGSVVFGGEHGFAANQPVVYVNTDPSKPDMPGLVSGRTYYCIPSSSSGKSMQLSASPLDGDGDGVVTLAEKIAAFTPIALGTPSAAANHSFLPAGGIKLIPQLALQVRSYVNDSSITAVGALTQTAVDNASIDAAAYAGSAAASLGGAAGVSLGGAGATISNKIFTRIEAAIDGDGATGISAGSVSLRAVDTSTITSSAGAAAVAAALGGAVGASVAIGVGLSENIISNTIDARIINADQGVKATTGSITVAAESRSLISATAWAAAVAAAAGGLVGISGAGAGIGAVNSVANTVLAHIDSSKIDILAQNQNLSITATEASSLSALGVAAALAAAVGGGAGVAIGVGGGTATNVVANTVKAYTTGATINTSSSAATAGTGAITISASANETAKLQLIGAAGSVAVGFAAVAGAAAVAVAENRIKHTVSAYASGGTLKTPGSLTIAAQATETLTANAFAAAAAVAAGFGGALAAGGGIATNTLNNSVSADVLGSAALAAGGNVAITAANAAEFNSSVTAVAVAGGMYGGSIGMSMINNTDTSTIGAKVSSGSVSSKAGGVSIAASATDTTGTMLGIATAVTAGTGGAGAGTDVRSDFSPTLFSTVASGATVAATVGTVSITSTLSSQARATTYGAAGGLVAIGTASGYATANGTVEAIANGTITAGSIVLNSQATTSAEFSGTGLAGGLVAGAVGRAEATSSPNVKALVGSSGTLTATGAVQVFATAKPSANATSLGVAVGVGALGESKATSTSSPLVYAGIGGNVSSSSSNVVDWTQTQAGRSPVVLSGPSGQLASLDIRATIAPVSGGNTAHSRATAGAGGLVGIAGATANALSGGAVTAMIGNNIKLPNGNVGVLASGTTSQWAEGLGKAVGLVGVGGVSSTATSSVATLAQVGTGVTSDQSRQGVFFLHAEGNNTNRADTVSSSGGFIAGSCAFATTGDTSASVAQIGFNNRIYGTSFEALAYQQSNYNPTADASSASLAGASGSTTTNVSNTTASTQVGNNAVIDMLGKVELRAKNQFLQQFPSANGGFNAQGGAAGVAAAAAGSADSTLTGVSEVVLGDRVTVHSYGLVSNTDQYPIVMAATQGANTDNVSIMNSDGGLAGTGVASTLTATLTNRVTLGISNVVKTEAGDISIGTATDSFVKSTAETTTNAGLSLAFAKTTTTLTADQAVTIGSNSTFFANGNIWLTPGKDTANNGTPTNLAASASAQAHTKGLAGIPTAKATATVNSNAALTINTGTKIQTGGNVTIGGYPGTLTPVADGTGTGDQLFGLVTTVQKDSNPSKAETSTVTQNGTIEAGIFRTLKIVIPNKKNAGVVTQAAPTNYLIVDDPLTTTEQYLGSSAADVYSRTLQVNTDSDADPTNDLPFKPFGVTYDPAYNPIAKIDSYNFSDPTTAEVFKSGVTKDTVVAMRLEGLTARGGVVAINAASIQGSGTITAYGGPTITIDNNSPDYLVVSNLTIPNEVFGKVYFTGSAAAAPSLSINTPNAGVDPQITVNNNFSNTVGSEAAFGPALILVPSTPVTAGTTGTGIVNLAGAVNLTNVTGSIGQAGVVFAASFRAYAPNGFYAVSISNPDTTYFAGSNPISDWWQAMVLPGRISATDYTASYPDANLAAQYVANAVYNPNGLMGSWQLSNSLENRNGVLTEVNTYYNHYRWGFANAGVGDTWNYTQYDNKNSIIILGRNPDFVPGIQALPLTYAKNFSDIAVNAVPNLSAGAQAIPEKRTVEDTGKVGIAAGKIAISAKYVDINNKIESGRTVTVNITANQADLDGLVSLYSDLTSRGISLPATTTTSRVPAVIGQIRGLSSSVSDAIKNDLVARVCKYQWLGYFDGSQTARIPLQTLTDAQRSQADTYASAVAYGIQSPNNRTFSSRTFSYSYSYAKVNVDPFSATRTREDVVASYVAACYGNYSAGAVVSASAFSGAVAPSFDDKVAAATFGLATRSIDIGDINAVPGGGFVYINGMIINTSTAGLIKSVGGAGQVRVDNPTTYAMTVGSIKTSVSGASTVATSVVDIIDNNFPGSEQSVYLYTPGIGVQKFVGPGYTSERVIKNGVPQVDSWGKALYKVVNYKDIASNPAYLKATTAGTATTYAPMAGQRWQWQMQASMTRVPTTTITTGSTYTVSSGPNRPQVTDSWAFGTNTATGQTTTSPWAYVGPDGRSLQSTPYGKVITGQNIQSDFYETITGSFTSSVNFNYSNSWNDHRENSPHTWTEDRNYIKYSSRSFPTQGNLTLTASARADKPFAISFATEEGFVQVNSTGTLTLGQIVSPLGPVAVTVGSSSRLVPSTSVDKPFAIEAEGLTITALGSSIGTAAVPLELKLVPGTVFTATAGIGGVYVRGTGVVTLGAVASGWSDSTYGPVCIDAAAGIASDGNLVVGRSITLKSANATIGTQSMPIKVAPRGAVTNPDNRNVAAPSIKATASGDIRLQAEGDLWVDSISSVSGNVVVNAPAGKVLNLTNTSSADALGQALVERGWAQLQLTGAGAQARLDKVVANYEEKVATQYQAYWQLQRHGSVSGGVYSLNADKLSLYRLRVTLALGKSTDATDAEVQAYARGLYADVLSFFDRNFSTVYWAAKAAGNDSAAAAAVAGSSHSWMARSEFAADVGTPYAWTATSDQRTFLTANGVWSEASLKGAINFGALAGSAVVGTSAAPNITGRNVTINDTTVTPSISSAVGKVISAITITFDQLLGRNGASLSDDDRAALLTAGAPGDIELYGSKAVTVATTGTAALSSRNLLVGTAANLVVGMTVTASGIPAGTRIASISGRTVGLTAAVTSAFTNRSLSFGGTVDVQISFAGGEPIVPAGVTPYKIRLPQNAPLFVNALGTVSVNTVGSIYLQSTASDLNVGTIRSTSSSAVVDITAPGSIRVAAGGGGVITAGNLLLLAGIGSIGGDSPLPITVGGTLLSAVAGDRVSLSATGNLVYGQVYAGTSASIAATGSIEYSPDASGLISSGSVSLAAGTTIGQIAPVKVALGAGGSFTATAGGHLAVAGSATDSIFSATSVTSSTGNIDISVTGDAKLGTLTATQGTAQVAASGGIVAGQSSTANIVAKDAVFAANGGSVGAFNSDGSPATFLRQRVSGATRAAAFGRIALRQDAGNFNVAGIDADGDVSLTATAGSILNAPGILGNVITARNLILSASGAIGLPGQDLVVDLAAGYALSATAATGIQLTESSGDLRVARATTTSGGVRLTVPTGSFSLPADAVLQADSGPVLLQVRNDVSLAATSTAAAANWLAIVGNYGRTSGADSVLSTSRSDGTSVISSPYTSFGKWASASQGAATAASAGYSDAGKTTLATLGKAAGALAGAIVSDSRGNVTFFDPATNSLKQLDWTGTIRTATSSGINGATALAVDSSGNVFIADRNVLPVAVADSSFETTVIKTNGVAGYQYGPVVGSAWTFTAQSGLNGSGLTGNATALTGQKPSAPNGSQVAFIQGTGSISQSMTFEAGSYTLSLSAAQRQTASLNRQSIGVYVDGALVGTIAPTTSSYATLTTPAFTVTKGLHTISLRGLATSGDHTAFIDSVAITAAQAPSIKVWNAASGNVSKLFDTTSIPTGVAVDSAGNLFYADGSAVKKWAAATSTVSTLFSGTAPQGVALDAAGNLYVADAGANLVRKWTASSGVVSTLTAFTGLYAPQGITVDADGDVTVADTGNNRVVRLDTATGLVSTLISSGLSSPTGIALDSLGNLYTVNTGSSSSTLDVFQPWADVPSTLVGELAAAGTDALTAVIPTTQALYGAFVPTSDRSWLRATGVVDGKVQFAFDAAPGGLARTGHLTILGRQVTIGQAAGLSQTAVTSAPAVAYGSAGSVTLTVTSTYATPTGTVGLAVDGGATLLGTLVAGSSATLNGVTTYSATATILVAGLTAGDHGLVANYDTQDTFAGSTALGSLRVNRVASAAGLGSSNSSPTYGEQVTLTATVPVVGAGGTPTGTVTIKDGSQTLASGLLAGGSFTYSIASLLGGAHNLTVEYSGDANYLGSTSAAVIATVQQRSALPTLVVPAVSPTYGSVARLTATVPTAVAGTPATGTITFYDGQTLLGTGTTSVVGGALTATLDTAAIAGGSRSIRAEYSGDGTSYAATISASSALTVQLASRTAAVASDPNPAPYGTNASYIATLAAVGGGTKPTGTVQFYVAASVTGTAAIGAKVVTVSSAAGLAVGMVVSGTGIAPSTTILSISGNLATLSAATTAALSNTVLTGTMPVGGAQAIVDGQATVSTALLAAPLAVGTYAITSRYSGDGNYAASSSTAVTQTVSKGITVPAVVGVPSTTTFGNTVTFTVTVPRSGAGAIPTGTVQFLDNGVAISGGQATIDPATGRAAFTTSGLTAGQHSITVSYGGDANYSAGSVSQAFTQTVNKLSSNTSLATSTASSVYGQSVTLTASVPTVGTGGVPSGTVTFWNYANAASPVALSGAIPVDATGAAKFAITTLPAGSLQVRAIYSGNANYETTTSSAVTQAVGKVAAAAALVSSSASPSYGSAVTFTATVNPVTGGSTPTGTVQFLDGGTPIAGTVTYSVVNGALTAAITTSSLLGGTRTITAAYSGDSNYLAPASSPVVSQKVNAVAATATVSGSPNPSTYGTSVTFTAQVPAIAGGVTPSGTIQFFADASTTPLAGNVSYSVVNGVYTATLATAALTGGPHTVVAKYAGDTNYASATSASVSQQVSQATIAASLTSSASGTTPALGTAVTLTARVSGVTTGTVQFLDGTTVLAGTVGYSVVNGVYTATLTTSALSGGTRTITANYSSTNFIGTASLTQAIAAATMAPAITAMVGTSVSAAAAYLAAVKFTVTLGAVNGVYPQGTIQFKDRGVALGTPVALVLDTAAGKMTASYTTTTSSLTALAIGSHGITGTLSSTNTNFLTGTVSSESLFTVTPATTVTTASTVTLASTATTAEAGTSVTLTATVTAATAGLVEFWDGTTYLGRGSIVSGRVTLAVNAAAIPLSVGTHTIQARFVGSTTVRASVSSNLTLTIT